MSIHSKNWHASIHKVEAAYAEGESGGAYAQTKLASVTGLPYPKSYGDNMFPMQKQAKEAIESQDDGVYGGEVVSTGWEGIDSSREEYIQDSFYFDELILYKALQGSLPTSYALHWQDHIRAGSAADNLRYEAFGVFIKELSLKIPPITGKKDGFPSWTVKEGCYSVKYDDGAGTDVDSLVKTPWLPIGANPIATSGSFTIGGNAINGIEGELVIVNSFTEDKENSDDGLKYPYFLGFDSIEFTAKFRNYTQYKAFIVNVLKTVATEARYTIKITSGLAACFPQITNMQVKDGDLNRIPEKGMVSYNITFSMTEASVLTKEAS